MQKKKRIGVVFGIVIVTLLLCTVPAIAKTAQEVVTISYNNIKIVLNGSVVETGDEPFILEGRTYLPIRAISESLNLNVEWEEETKTVFLSEKVGQYHTESDFLNSIDGVAFQAVAFKAAKALLSADVDELSIYMVDSIEAAKAIQGISDIYGDVEYLFLIWSLNNIKSENEINASYRFALKGEDSVSFVTMELIKVDSEWKVNWLGLEK